MPSDTLLLATPSFEAAPDPAPFARCWVRRSAQALAAVLAGLVMVACGGGSDDSPADRGAAAAVVTHTVAPSDKAGKAEPPASSRKRALIAPEVATARFRANGWYWNPAESGSGFMFEAQGSLGFVAFFMYEEGTGKPIWYAATGTLTDNPDGSLSFVADLRYFFNGQPLSSPNFRSPSFRSVGTVTMRFTGTGATVNFPGRTMQATRFDFAGLNSATTASQPEMGWYWNPDEGGRGYAIEVQNNELFMAIFHYNDDGTPTWHTVGGNIASGTLTAPMRLYADGQSLTSAYRASNTRFDIGSLTLSFRNPCAGQIQRAGSAAVGIRRYVFGDLDAGTECHTAAAGLTDVPGLQPGPVQMQPGDTVFGTIDASGDVDAYGIALQANVSYQFDLQGYTTGQGSLWDPVLQLYDSQLAQVAADDDGSGYLDSRLVFTPTTSGTYYLAAGAYQRLTGSFVLKTSGVAAGLVAQPVPVLSSYAGQFDGVYVGHSRGTLRLTVNTLGNVTGVTTPTSANQPARPVSGTVVAGGVVRLTVAGTSTSYTGYLSPAGDLTGTWSDAAGAGGIYATSRAGLTFP